MKKSICLLTIMGIFVVGISTASAALIAPGMINDFQDGLTHGWSTGQKIESNGRPVVVQQGDNYYLEVISVGDKPNPNDPVKSPNKRMTVRNGSHDWSKVRWLNPEPIPGAVPFTSDWAGDYSNIGKIEGRVKVSTDEADTVFMRMTIDDFFIHSEKGVGYLDNSVVEIPTNGEWIDFSFSFNPDDFHPGGWAIKQGDDARSLEELITDVSSIRFSVYKDLEDRNIVFKGAMGLDDIRVSAVPLPGAAWLMIAGLLSLSGLSSYKRRHTA